MKELTKSFFGYTWAMSLFGLQQVGEMATGMSSPQETAGKIAQRFDNVTSVASGEIGETMRATFDAGNNLQRGMVDAIASGLSMFDPRRWSGAMSEPGAPASPCAGGRPANPFAKSRPGDPGMPG